ncbi:hypothetical protein NL676_024461 [Syzygium grande]|nr:hypothetical protein NL676_024461 [Syzygium grande]
MASASLFLSAVPSSPALPSRRGSPAPPPSAARCRPLQVSASCATSTAERPGPRPMAAGARSQPSSLYEVLGIRPGATGQEIKSAYRRLARVLHPDVAAGAGRGGARVHAGPRGVRHPLGSRPAGRLRPDPVPGGRPVRGVGRRPRGVGAGAEPELGDGSVLVAKEDPQVNVRDQWIRSILLGDMVWWPAF